jgi:hypothetical protein
MPYHIVPIFFLKLSSDIGIAVTCEINQHGSGAIDNVKEGYHLNQGVDISAYE